MTARGSRGSYCQGAQREQLIASPSREDTPDPRLPRECRPDRAPFALLPRRRRWGRSPVAAIRLDQGSVPGRDPASAPGRGPRACPCTPLGRALPFQALLHPTALRCGCRLDAALGEQVRIRVLARVVERAARMLFLERIEIGRRALCIEPVFSRGAVERGVDWWPGASAPASAAIAELTAFASSRSLSI